MAHVHISVNEMSRLYLSNERRYNYTTPKSFLEQIKLYQNLLLKKDRDLKAKMERLENGLEKLKSTSAQVRTPWGWFSLFLLSGSRENFTGKKFVLDPGSSLGLSWVSGGAEAMLYTGRRMQKCVSSLCCLGGN